MYVDTVQRRCQLESQKKLDLVYVDYLEAAPWNCRTALGVAPLFSGVGSILLITAIQRSFELEFKGRVGLHALPQSVDFYQAKMGMTELGPDPAKDNLRYFELTPEQAEALLPPGGV